MRELIELCGKVLERVLCKPRKGLLQVRENCVAPLPGGKVTDFDKAWQKLILFYCSKFALAALSSANDPEARHQIISDKLSLGIRHPGTRVQESRLLLAQVQGSASHPDQTLDSRRRGNLFAQTDLKLRSGWAWEGPWRKCYSAIWVG
jgi:hypothetical protein